jgi:hypothetical protein
MRRTLLHLCLLAAAVPAAGAHAQTVEARGVASVPRDAVRLAGAGDKVTAPVEVEIAPQPDPRPGVRRVRITARPTVDAASLTVEVGAEDGLSVAVPASATWTGAARARQEVSCDVDFTVSGPGELRLVVTATVKQADDFTQTGIHEFALNPSAATRAAGLTKSFRPVATDPGGRTVVEVPAKTP